MEQLNRPLCAAVNRFRQYIRTRAEATQREVDAFLRASLKEERPSWGRAFAFSRCIVIGSFFRPAVHVAAVAILLIVIGSGIFIPLDSTDFLTRLSLISVAMLVGTSLSYLLLFLLLPLHLRYRLSLWAIAAIHTPVAAVLFSLIEPEIIRNFQDYIVPSFGEIFVPILLLYGLADLFVLWQFKDEICVREYARKHSTDHIATLLPADKRGEVWLMSAADHYVEFFTDQGSHMRRMTMKAAVEKMAKADGMRVHRSHWVAYSAMLSIEKDGERFFLTLRSGQRVPVSRQNAARVACFLDADCQQAAE